MLDRSINQYQIDSANPNPAVSSPVTPPNNPQTSTPTTPLQASSGSAPPPPVFGQESSPPSIPDDQASNPQIMQHQLNQAATQVLDSSSTPQPPINHTTTTVPSVSSPAITKPNAKTTPKEVVAAPPTASLTTIPATIAAEIKETPLVQTKELDQNQPKVSWKQAAVVGVGLFFAGALLAIIIMLMLY